MPSKTESSIKELEQREKRIDKLPLLLDFYLKLLRVQAATEQAITVPQPLLSEVVAGERLGKGEPLLRFRELKLDNALLSNTFAEISRVFTGYPDLFEINPEIIREMDTGLLLDLKVLERWYSRNVVPRKGLPRGMNRHVMANLILSTLKPYLVSYQATLIGMVHQDSWRRGYCPVCGGMPDLSYLESKNGARWLVCSRCDAEWGFQRMECPYCGNLDNKTLAYY
ncbi:MAG: formate dehydrogenase accessory protein FdhE, partial [Dehalococcoidales bacterium]